MLMNRCFAQVLCFGEALIDRLGPLGVTGQRSPAAGLRSGGPGHVGLRPWPRLAAGAALIRRLGNDGSAAAFNQLFRRTRRRHHRLQSDPPRPSRIVLVRRDADGERSYRWLQRRSGAGFADQAIEAAARRRPWSHC